MNNRATDFLFYFGVVPLVVAHAIEHPLYMTFAVFLMVLT